MMKKKEELVRVVATDIDGRRAWQGLDYLASLLLGTFARASLFESGLTMCDDLRPLFLYCMRANRHVDDTYFPVFSGVSGVWDGEGGQLVEDFF